MRNEAGGRPMVATGLATDQNAPLHHRRYTNCTNYESDPNPNKNSEGSPTMNDLRSWGAISCGVNGRFDLSKRVPASEQSLTNGNPMGWDARAMSDASSVIRVFIPARLWAGLAQSRAVSNRSGALSNSFEPCLCRLQSFYFLVRRQPNRL